MRKNQEKIRVLCVRDYYNSEDARELAHMAKSNDQAAITRMASEMAEIIPANAVLIPTPSRLGYATVTLSLANKIAAITGCEVSNIVKGNERESLYDIKIAKEEVPDDFFGFRLTGSPPPGRPVIIDTVFATGQTASGISKLFDNPVVLTHSRVDLFKLQSKEIDEAENINANESINRSEVGGGSRSESDFESALSASSEDWSDRLGNFRSQSASDISPTENKETLGPHQ